MRSHKCFIPFVITVSIVLAYAPVSWLLRTWVDPSWASDGELTFPGIVLLVVWSLRSPIATSNPRLLAWTWLGVSAIVRAVGNVLAINVLGALMLCVDVYAIARLLRLDERENRVSPAWLAAAFAFSLPVERIIQRLVGHALQWVSAKGAYGLLSIVEHGVSLNGTELSIRGTRVLVDLPCSGARGLIVLTVSFLLLAAVRRPAPLGAAFGMFTVGLSAYLSNTLRIFMLAEGIVHHGSWGIDMMSQPWHDLVGLVCLAFGLAPLIYWARRVPQAKASWKLPAPRPRSALAMLGVGVVTLFLAPQTPLDVSRRVAPPQLPAFVSGHLAVPAELSELEARYFTEFGGGAARATYGSMGLLVVRTSSPVRHLHSPEECMAGAGWDVQRIGITGAVGGATWRITRGPDELIVRATYVSSTGMRVTTLEEAIWMWFADPALVWTAVERIYPVNTSVDAQDAFDHEVFHRLNLKENNSCSSSPYFQSF